jgi:hypothetical protein
VVVRGSGSTSGHHLVRGSQMAKCSRLTDRPASLSLDGPANQERTSPHAKPEVAIHRGPNNGRDKRNGRSCHPLRWRSRRWRRDPRFHRHLRYMDDRRGHALGPGVRVRITDDLRREVCPRNVVPANASGEHRLPLETRRFDRNAVCPSPSCHFASPWKSMDTLQSIARGFDLLTQQLFDVIMSLRRTHYRNFMRYRTCPITLPLPFAVMT